MQARRRYSKLALWVNIKTVEVEENLELYEIFFSNKGFFPMGEIAFLPKRALAHLLDAFMTVWKAKEDIGFTNREKKSAFHWFWTFQMSSFLSITSSHLVLYPMMSLRPRKWRKVGKRNIPVSGELVLCLSFRVVCVVLLSWFLTAWNFIQNQKPD